MREFFGIRENREYECLDKCWETLSLQEREIVVTLGACDKSGEGEASKIRHRRELAAKLGITDDDLGGEVRRIRAKMKHCVRQCLSAD